MAQQVNRADSAHNNEQAAAPAEAPAVQVPQAAQAPPAPPAPQAAPAPQAVPAPPAAPAPALPPFFAGLTGDQPVPLLVGAAAVAVLAVVGVAAARSLGAINPLVLLFVAAVLASMSVRVVPQGYVVHIMRLGAYSRTLPAGLHFIVPLVETPRRLNWSRTVEVPGSGGRGGGRGDGDSSGSSSGGSSGSGPGATFSRARTRLETKTDELVPLAVQAFDIAPVEVTTADRVSVSVNVVIFLQVFDPVRAVFDVDDAWNSSSLLLATAVRAAVSRCDYDAARTRGREICADVASHFEERSRRWGVRVVEVDLQSVEPGRAVRQAAEAVAAAQRESEARAMRARAVREAAEIEAATAASAARTKAESAALVTRTAAMAERDAAAMRAEAEAARVRALLAAGADAAYLRAALMSDAWKALAASSNHLVVPIDSAGLLGSVQASRFAAGSLVGIRGDSLGSHSSSAAPAAAGSAAASAAAAAAAAAAAGADGSVGTPARQVSGGTDRDWISDD